MSGPFDINRVIRDGQYSTNRSKSPAPPPYHSSRTPTFPQAPSFESRHVPRSFEIRAAPSSSRSRWPPPPSVEDEADSLAREHGSVVSEPAEEGPKSKGDADQNPVIMEVHEFNPERRFVLVSQDSDGGGTSDSSSESPLGGYGARAVGAGDEYEDYAGRRYDPDRLQKLGKAGAAAGVATGIDTKRTSSERRKSMNHQDLPRIETRDLDDESPSQMYRTKSASRADPPPLQDDYFSPQHGRRPTEGLLSPEMVKHTSAGRREREERYYDDRRGSNGNVSPVPMQRSKSNATEDRRYDPRYNDRPSASSPAAKRASSSFESKQQQQQQQQQQRQQPRQTSGDRYVRDEYAGSRPDKKNASPPYSRDRQRDANREPERMQRRSSTYKRESPPRPGDGSEGDEYAKPTRTPSYRRRKSIVMQEGYTLNPESGRAEASRSRSRAPPSPIPSPNVSQKQFDDVVPGPRASFTFPRRFDQPGEKPVAAPYPEDDVPARANRLGVPIPGSDSRGSRSRSRASSIKNPIVSMPTMPVPIPIGSGTATELKRSPMPSPTESRHVLSQSSPRQTQFRQPQAQPFSPGQLQRTNSLDKPVGMYRRYSEDLDRGGMPDLPECRRKKPVAGLTDWITLPRCENFNMCPECYSSVFQNSAYENQLAPFPFRPPHKPIACDFGANTWYRIAWLLTLKNRKPDLSLFRAVAAVAANTAATNEPCPGPRKVTRTWFSVRNPQTGKTLPDFNVCFGCAKTVEALLPNLSGIFVHLEASAAPTRGVCAMHFVGNERKRFILYFDALETTSDRALERGSPPDLQRLAEEVEMLSPYTECRGSTVVRNGNWHVMQRLPELTVCGECFDEAVRPRLDEDDDALARRFYVKPQRLPLATCQLYSPRMREVFRRACARGDAKYLEDKVTERRAVEEEISAQIAKLDERGENDAETEEEVSKLYREWRKWE